MKISIDKLKINPEYEKLVPTLSTSDYETLRDSLDKFGFREAYPVVINRDNEILDGHHRYKICKEIGLTEIPVQIEEFENKLDEKEWVILTNIARRQLNTAQKGELFLAILEIERERAKKRQNSTLPERGQKGFQKVNVGGTGGPTLNPEEKGKSVEIAAKKVGISKKTGYQVLKIKKAAEEHDEVKKSWQDAINGKKSVAKVHREAVRIEKREQKMQEAEVVAKNFNPSENVQIIHGDIREVGNQIEDESIDLILTDPPYGKEYLYCWEELGKLAQRVLKPSSFLVTYSGHINLPDYINLLLKNLKFYWICGVLHTGLKELVHPRNLYACWKPVLIFYKPPFRKADTLFEDIIIGSGRDSNSKLVNSWSQPLEESISLINIFSEANNTILDPFAGTGTVLVAGIKEKRKVIGIEKEENVRNSIT